MRFLGYNSQHGDANGKIGRIDRIENKSGMNWKQLSEYYEIPYRTIQD